jgi:hypothetical protein
MPLAGPSAEGLLPLMIAIAMITTATKARRAIKVPMFEGRRGGPGSWSGFMPPVSQAACQTGGSIPLRQGSSPGIADRTLDPRLRLRPQRSFTGARYRRKQGDLDHQSPSIGNQIEGVELVGTGLRHEFQGCQVQLAFQ